MECDLLISCFKNPETIELVNENIRRIADGSSSHSAHALKHGLKKAFDLKGKPPGVMLRCSSTGCPSYNIRVSISSVGKGAFYCITCSAYYLQCAGCGARRTGDHALCLKCKKTFV